MPPFLAQKQGKPRLKPKNKGQKWPKMDQNGPKRTKTRKNEQKRAKTHSRILENNQWKLARSVDNKTTN